MLKPLKVRVASNEIKELQMVDVPKLPDLDGKTPKEMRRAWLRFMADCDWTAGSVEYGHAEFVRLSIEMMILNIGLPSEEWARNTFRRQFATFSEIWTHRRG